MNYKLSDLPDGYDNAKLKYEEPYDKYSGINVSRYNIPILKEMHIVAIPNIEINVKFSDESDNILTYIIIPDGQSYEFEMKVQYDFIYKIDFNLNAIKLDGVKNENNEFYIFTLIEGIYCIASTSNNHNAIEINRVTQIDEGLNPMISIGNHLNIKNINIKNSINTFVTPARTIACYINTIHGLFNIFNGEDLGFETDVSLSDYNGITTNINFYPHLLSKTSPFSGYTPYIINPTKDVNRNIYNTVLFTSPIKDITNFKGVMYAPMETDSIKTSFATVYPLDLLITK